jgi:hypothetical protein
LRSGCADRLAGWADLMGAGVLATMAAALAALLVALRHRRRIRDEAALRALFAPESGLIGKDFEYVVQRAGPPRAYGSMDHGRDVARWRAGRVSVELWFQNGVCTDVEILDVSA